MHRIGNFLLDPGWPYVLAGVLMLLAAGLIPSELELKEREANLADLRTEIEEATRLHAAYGGFLDDLAVGNQSLVKRLVAAQLGLVPGGQEPMSVWKTLEQSPSRWIERAAVHVRPSRFEPMVTTDPPFQKASTLSGIIDGTGRLWVFALALVVIFIGLLFNPGEVREPACPEPRTT